MQGDANYKIIDGPKPAPAKMPWHWIRIRKYKSHYLHEASLDKKLWILFMEEKGYGKKRKIKCYGLI